MPYAPCICPAEAKQETEEDLAYRVRFIESLSFIERKLCEVTETADANTAVFVSACNALMKLAELRHSTFAKHREAIDVERLQASLDEITASVSGHETASDVGQDEDDTSGEGDYFQ